VFICYPVWAGLDKQGFQRYKHRQEQEVRRMKKWTWAILIALTLSAGTAGLKAADQFVVCPPDVKKRQQLCALMLRYGKDAVARLQFAQAREFFRKAVQADPTSVTAWSWYDRSLLLTMAWHLRKKGLALDLRTAPQVKPATPGAAPTPAPKPTAPKPKPSAGAPIPPEEPDEGC
jgi:hypothetical protein